jgi:signal transduction histidine kinase
LALVLCAATAQALLITGQALRLSLLPEWGVFFWVCSLLAVIRRQIVQADAETRRLTKQMEQENKSLRKIFQASKAAANQVSVEKQLLAVKLHEHSQRLEDANQRITTDQETLQKTRNRLIEAERLSHLGAMVAGLAHELNTPLGVGVMAASNLEKEIEELHGLFESGGMKKSDLERHLQTSEESAAMILVNLRGAAELIKSFKLVAADQNVDTRRSFPLKQYLDQILLSLKPMTAKTSHMFRVSCDEGITVYGQPGAFSQIITNFITNSIVHAFRPEEAGLITIDAFRDQDYIALRYADNGRGIPPDVLPRIFEPFYTTRKGNEGTGLGLHIIHSIVTEQFGGVMSCESEENKGTIFYLRFPVKGEQQYER